MALTTYETSFQRWADWLASVAGRVLLITIAVSLAGGVINAVTWRPGGDDTPSPAPECAQPPCFELNLDRIRISDLPSVLAFLGYLLMLLLTVPSFLMGLWDLIRRRWAEAGRRMLIFGGLVLVFVGIEVLPHLLLPCGLLPSVCEALPGYGLNVKGQWHLLDHTLVGAVPMALLYWFMIRRWRLATTTWQ